MTLTVTHNLFLAKNIWLLIKFRFGLASVMMHKFFEIDTDKIQFGQYYEYHFNQTESCDGCTADDEITVLNGALMAVVGLLQQYKIEGSTSFG